METSFDTLMISESKQHVMLVTLNRPAAANALNTQLGTEIMMFFEALSLDAGDIRCVVVTGAGDRPFAREPILRSA
jgi:enoyl-CoA hydratase/carnithine racemase